MLKRYVAHEVYRTLPPRLNPRRGPGSSQPSGVPAGVGLKRTAARRPGTTICTTVAA